MLIHPIVLLYVTFPLSDSLTNEFSEPTVFNCCRCFKKTSLAFALPQDRAQT